MVRKTNTVNKYAYTLYCELMLHLESRSFRISLFFSFRSELEGSVVKPELEKNDYHRLSLAELEALSPEPEALFQRGYRLRHGISVKANEDLGWELTIEAARAGHPVATARCYEHGVGAPKDLAKALSLSHESAARGHSSGTLRTHASHTREHVRVRTACCCAGWSDGCSAIRVGRMPCERTRHCAELRGGCAMVSPCRGAGECWGIV
jgi:hypothetical protein